VTKTFKTLLQSRATESGEQPERRTRFSWPTVADHITIRIAQSHGGQRGSDTDQYNWPFHLEVDNNQFVFVADLGNRRVSLLSPTLDYIRRVVSSDNLMWRPDRLCLDIHRRRLYVADNESIAGRLAGRVVVFSV